MDSSLNVDRGEPGYGLSGLRVGFGFDTHEFKDDRPLVLGGVRIRENRGLIGHSDADVLTHAIIDALLGAAGIGDIGEMFPDTDPAYSGANSIELLERVIEMPGLAEATILNIDAVIVAEEPKLAPFRREMEEKLGNAFGSRHPKVSVKATTTEGMGFTGRREGIAALVTLLAWMPKAVTQE
ncbi:MAG: 2-C-methyl-D-erythritol 2,4-cyclodiphosphate synthase [Deltaproteobacteria bacterium]|nr:2-C-methyl-D-erythritol 2,4-cyclodiphosphate synthase [Deltaproteobacteria bacterium]